MTSTHSDVLLRPEEERDSKQKDPCRCRLHSHHPGMLWDIKMCYIKDQERTREEGHEGPSTQSQSQPRVKSEIRYSEVEKGKIIEATGKREILRKSG